MKTLRTPVELERKRGGQDEMALFRRVRVKTSNPPKIFKDYPFTTEAIDEEIHGKAVALLDFEREHGMNCR